MTNNWTDMANSSAFVIMGANPVENHPASFAHINAARAKGAKLVVIDPRRTRTACQVNPDAGDRYIRIRPGTDIAFLMGVVRRIIEKMDDDADTTVTDTQRSKFFEFLNYDSSGTCWTDGDATGASSKVTAVAHSSKHTDARFLVAADGTDYQRIRVDTSGVETSDPAGPSTISNVPAKVTEAAGVQSDPNTVYNRLKAHVEPYTADVVADICGCDASEVEFVAGIYIENSRCSSVADATDAPQDPTDAGYKALTMLYAMGQTQHTVGSQNVKSFAVIQTLMGNMGRAGGGINALRGIHNVQGSTDMGNLYHLIPFYSGNPTEMSHRVDATGVWDATGSYATQGYGKYMDKLWNGFGKPLSGSVGATDMDGSYDAAYRKGDMGWQARGFFNMTFSWFGDLTWAGADATGDVSRPLVDALYDLWPKTNGDDHITMFRKAGAGTIGAMLVWGQNPAVTEPNQSAVRDGLKNLEMLAVVDVFETETAACDRKDGAVTYLIPAASHVEEAGSVTNSGRCLQWRERATMPKGNCKSDLELMFRLAKAFDDAGAFQHITDVWDTPALALTYDNAYDTLYGDRYGYYPGVNGFYDVTKDVEVWHGVDTARTAGAVNVDGCEAIAEMIYQEMCKGTSLGGMSWLYNDAYATNMASRAHTGSGQTAWTVLNRSKSRDNKNYDGQNQYPGWGYSWLVNRRVLYNNGENAGDMTDGFQGPDGAARLFVSTNANTLNYSNNYRYSHTMADKPDVTTAANGCYNAASPHFIARTDAGGDATFAGRFPGHCEPYETPREDLADDWGRNTKGGAQFQLVPSDTAVAATDRSDDPADFPFVLTTIRCVEHFQGGPITRNNPWNVELEPEPWIEINSLDAAACNPPIKTGDLVQVTTARSNSTTNQNGRTITVGVAGNSSFAQGFRARVGVGLAGNQRVGVGVVAIPWHWGDKGLSTGSRANDLCIDAGDANTTIPEYKACLCNIEKI